MVFRAYTPADLPACEELLRQATDPCDFAIVWESEALSRQLSGGGVGETLIAEEAGQPVGFINWHCLPFLGRTEEVVAVIDLIALPGLSLRRQRRIVYAALSRMRSLGAVLALKLKIGDYDPVPLVTTGFVPRWPDSYVLATWAGEPASLAGPSRMHLLWR
jgi:hypothetical protein